MTTTNDLTTEQQASFLQHCKTMGISAAVIPEKVVIASGTTACLAADSRYPSAIQHHSFTVDNLTALKELTDADAAGEKSVIGPLKLPAPWEKTNSLTDLDGHELRRLEQALKLVLSGHGDQVASYTNALNSHFFPMSVIGFAATTVTVKSGSVLRIKGNGHNLVYVNYGNLILEEGGQIICETNVTMTVQNFTKKGTN